MPEYTRRSGTPLADRLGPLSVIHGLHGLWASRVIGQDAFFLGAQVCQRMLHEKTIAVDYSGELAHSHYTVLSGAVYTGPIAKDLTSYITALQDLHFRGGLLSSLNPVDITNSYGDETRTHFTVAPDMLAGSDYDYTTRIYFHVLNTSKEDFFEAVNRLAAASMSGARPAILDEN